MFDPGKRSVLLIVAIALAISAIGPRCGHAQTCSSTESQCLEGLTVSDSAFLGVGACVDTKRTVPVGIGTCYPLHTPLHVEKDDIGLPDQALDGDTLVLESVNVTLGLYSVPIGSQGSAIVLAHVNPDPALPKDRRLINKWTIIRSVSPKPSEQTLDFRYGACPDNSEQCGNDSTNRVRFRFKPNGDMDARSIGLEQREPLPLPGGTLINKWALTRGVPGDTTLYLTFGKGITNAGNPTKVRFTANGDVHARSFRAKEMVLGEAGEARWRMFEDIQGLYVQNLGTGETSRVFLDKDVQLVEKGFQAKLDAIGTSLQRALDTTGILERRIADLQAELEAIKAMQQGRLSAALR